MSRGALRCGTRVVPPRQLLLLHKAREQLRLQGHRAHLRRLPGLRVRAAVRALRVPEALRRLEDRIRSGERNRPQKTVQLPLYQFDNPQKPGEPTECLICLQDFRSGELLRHLPCGHRFHAACADEWLRSLPQCPLRCPNDLDTPDGAGVVRPAGPTATAPEEREEDESVSGGSEEDDIEKGAPQLRDAACHAVTQAPVTV
mmetsp:Transcript_109971/g.342878  ORF Transcript_109971/g.342878 Transcript_109971/m.342878 type:complete len:201 (+) Transcript_109971:376-978(+)